jgi:hypothetical protein
MIMIVFKTRLPEMKKSREHETEGAAIYRSEVVLNRLNNNLYLENGDLYFLDIQDSNTLTYVDDMDGATHRIKKLYATTNFDSGRLSLAFDSVSYINSNIDICASRYTSTYTGYIPNTVVRPDTVTITAPYLNSFIQITLLFKEINNQIYDLVGLSDFLLNGLNTVHIEISSPEFSNRYPSGMSALSISSGTIEILESTHPNLRLRGVIYTDSGEQVVIDADVVFR